MLYITKCHHPWLTSYHIKWQKMHNDTSFNKIIERTTLQFPNALTLYHVNVLYWGVQDKSLQLRYSGRCAVPWASHVCNMWQRYQLNNDLKKTTAQMTQHVWNVHLLHKCQRGMGVNKVNSYALLFWYRDIWPKLYSGKGSK